MGNKSKNSKSGFSGGLIYSIMMVACVGGGIGAVLIGSIYYLYARHYLHSWDVDFAITITFAGLASFVIGGLMALAHK